MLTLIENGEVYAPKPLGRRSVLLVDGRVGKVGKLDRRALDALGIEHEVIADVLKLERKGRLEQDKDGGVLVLRRGSLDIVHVIAHGKRMVDDGSVVVTERFAPTSNRRIDITGTKGQG